MLEQVRAAVPTRTVFERSSLRFAVTLLGAAALVLLPHGLSASWLRTLTEALLFAYYAQCWNVSAGFAGMFSIAHPVFVAAGAYATSLLLIHVGLSPWIGMFAGAGIAACAAALLGLVTSRLSISRIYFALFTMALWTVVVAVATVWGYIGADAGLLVPIRGGLSDFNLSSVGYYYVILAFVVLAAILTRQLLRSRLGLGFIAYRDDETAARSSGVSVVRTQVVSLVVSSTMVAFAGAFYAMFYRYVSPDTVLSFGITQTMILGTMVGGLCTVYGPVVGGVAFGVLGNALRNLPFLSGGTRGDVFTTGVYALLLILTVRFMPLGLASVAGLLRRKVLRPARGRGPERREREGDTAPPSPSRDAAAIALGWLQPGPAEELADPDRPLLHVESLSMQIGGLLALDGVSFDVSPGEVLAVIGPNGAGKTTLFNCLSGLSRPTAGSATLGGTAVVGESPAALFRHGLGRTFQIAKPFPTMSALHAVAVAASPYASSFRDAVATAEATLEFVQFAAAFDARGADLSNVNRKRLEVARALAGRPRVLLLDEVCAGLSSGEVGDFVEVLRRIAQAGIAIVMVEHVLEAVVALADRIHVLDHGRTIAAGDPEQILSSEVVAAAYLGRRRDREPRAAAVAVASRHEPAPSSAPANALEVRGLSACYGDVVALRGVDFAIEAGTTTAILGANGAGKTSLLRRLSGLDTPSGTGEVHLFGELVGGKNPDEIVGLGLVQVPENRQIFQNLTVRENLEMGAHLRAARRRAHEQHERVAELFPRLLERRDQVAGTLSGGEQQMLAIGRAMMANPRILLLDEPSLGIAPAVVEQLFETLEVLSASGLTLVVAEQNASQALAIADKAIVLSLGTVRIQGATAQVLDDPEVRRAYLGGVDAGAGRGADELTGELRRDGAVEPGAGVVER